MLEEVAHGEDVDADSAWDFGHSTIEKGVHVDPVDLGSTTATDILFHLNNLCQLVAFLSGWLASSIISSITFPILRQKCRLMGRIMVIW